MQHCQTSKLSVDVPAHDAEKTMRYLHELYESGKEIGTLELEGIVTIHNVGILTSIGWDAPRFSPYDQEDRLTVTVSYLRKPVPKQNL